MKKMRIYVFPRKCLFIKKAIKLCAILVLALTPLACEDSFEELSVKPEVNLPVLKTISTSGKINVMSFNIRHHDNTDPQSLDQRKSSILQVVIDNNPDIVGLQEFADNWFEDWMKAQMTSLGYVNYMDESAGFGSPKVIFYKSNRFQRLNQGTFQVRLTENRSGTWVCLLDNVTNIEYFVCNSHWTTISSSERVTTANTMKSVIESNSGGRPLIVFGDFNAQPGTPEISVIKNTGGANNLVCTHSESGNTYHRWDATGYSKLDWLFCSRSLAFTSSSVVATSYGGYWPSDHWPVKATIMPAVFGGVHYDANGISGSSKTRFYFADVNGDGKDDKIYWNPTYDTGRTRVYLSNGNGTFTFADSNIYGGSESEKTRFYFADVDGDGAADKIYWNPTYDTGHTRVYLSNRDGSFRFADSNIYGGSQSDKTRFYFADVNGDGAADKIYWNPTYDSGHTRVYLSNGDGSFRFTNSNVNGGSQSDITRYYFVDVNGDGKADKIYWNPTYDSGRTRVYLSNGDGTFSFANSNTNGTSVTTNTTFYFADISGDGKADKVYWNPGNFMGKLLVYTSNGNGTFSGPIFSLRGTSQSANTKFYFADITGGGKADLIRWNFEETPSGYSKGTLKNYHAN